MSPPPTSIDGTDITGATIDGQEVQEITVDGDIVFTAGPELPNPGNLQLRIDARDDGRSAAAITTIPDLQNNFDLSGDASLSDTGPEGLRSYSFDGTQQMGVDFTELTQPITQAFLFQLQEGTSLSANKEITDANSGAAGSRPGTFAKGQGDQWAYFAGSAGIDSNVTIDENTHIMTVVFDGPNSFMRLDGTKIASGDGGSATLNGFKIAERVDNVDNSDIEFVEVLLYTVDESSNISDIEVYLDRDTNIIP
jgi:hypothetical protein